MFIKLHKLSFDQKSIDDLFVDPLMISAFYRSNDPKYTLLIVGDHIFTVVETAEQITSLVDEFIAEFGGVDGGGDAELVE